jgi:hypothetical protein
MTGPQTYHEAGDGSLPEQIARYHELSERDLLAGSIATLKARGTYQPTEHVNDERFPPLTVAEHLEMLALGERIAHYYRHPVQVHRAVKAGATWEQIAAATDTTAGDARAAYREWAEGQHTYAGMSDAEYAAALEAAGEPDTAAEDTRCLEAIRAVLACFDWEHDDRQYALEQIERIAGGGQA